MHPQRCKRPNRRHQAGLTLTEMMLALAAASLLAVALGGVLGQFQAGARAQAQLLDRQREAEFALQRMLRSILLSPRLLVPLADNPATGWREHVREQTVPASAPETGSTLASAVLALATPVGQDLDGDGTPDADDDGDGAIDEDPGADATNDWESGVAGIDDNGDGGIDEGLSIDDDEDGNSNDEDRPDGLDNDGDGSVDEDPGGDRNGDFCPGLCGIDDDGDGSIDEGNTTDDDEDGVANEDGVNPRVYRLVGGDLVERLAVPWDTNSDTLVNGLDFVESVLVGDVARLRFERIAPAGGRAVLVDVQLDLTRADGPPVSVQGRVRLGGGL